MNISLTPKLEQYVQEKVDSGMYTSASEVVRESLRFLHTFEDQQIERLKQFNRAIEVGLYQLDAGQKIPAEESYTKLKDKISKIEKESQSK